MEYLEKPGGKPGVSMEKREVFVGEWYPVFTLSSKGEQFHRKERIKLFSVEFLEVVEKNREVFEWLQDCLLLAINYDY